MDDADLLMLCPWMKATGNLQGFYRAPSDFEIFPFAVLVECGRGMRTVSAHERKASKKDRYVQLL